MEADYHEQRRTAWFLWKVSLKLSDIRSLLSEICEGKAPASCTVFNWVRSFKSGRETVQKDAIARRPTT